MEFIRIVVDFFVLGLLGLFSTVTIGIWYIFIDSFIFKQGYLSLLANKKLLKVIFIFITGLIIWGSAIVAVHKLLWVD